MCEYSCWYLHPETGRFTDFKIEIPKSKLSWTHFTCSSYDKFKNWLKTLKYENGVCSKFLVFVYNTTFRFDTVHAGIWIFFSIFIWSGRDLQWYPIYNRVKTITCIEVLLLLQVILKKHSDHKLLHFRDHRSQDYNLKKLRPLFNDN